MSEVDEIKKAHKKAKLPDWVESTHVEAMNDHTAEPAERVIVVRADREESVKDGEALAAVVQKTHAAVDKAGVELFPYTRFTISGEAGCVAAEKRTRRGPRSSVFVSRRHRRASGRARGDSMHNPGSCARSSLWSRRSSGRWLAAGERCVRGDGCPPSRGWTCSAIDDSSGA